MARQKRARPDGINEIVKIDPPNDQHDAKTAPHPNYRIHQMASPGRLQSSSLEKDNGVSKPSSFDLDISRDKLDMKTPYMKALENTKTPERPRMTSKWQVANRATFKKALHESTSACPGIGSCLDHALGDQRVHNRTKPTMLTPPALFALQERIRMPPDDGGLWSGPKIGRWLAQFHGLKSVSSPRASGAPARE
jgi:hypothetical protein